jgi:hypothetical protein
MALVIVILAPLLIILLARSFVLNAVALRRDMNKRFDDVRVRLENAANSTVQHLLNANARNNAH